MASPPDVRRWIRHARDLQGYVNVWAQSGVEPTGPRLVAPWLSDTVQLVTPVPPANGQIGPAAVVAAGAEWSIQVPRREKWKLISGVFTLVTAVAAANRRVRLELVNQAGTQLWLGQSLNLQSASLSRAYCVSANPVELGSFGDSTFHSVHSPPDLWMESGFLMQTNTVALQAADLYSAIILFVEVWPG